MHARLRTAWAAPSQSPATRVQGMIKEADEAPESREDPLDEKYASLHAVLNLLPESDPQYKVLQTYLANTHGGRGMKLRNVWTVEGEKDGAAFTQHSAALPNHKLLWHGTNVAVVAAILNGGLRIMPHSGALHPPLLPPQHPPLPSTLAALRECSVWRVADSRYS